MSGQKYTYGLLAHTAADSTSLVDLMRRLNAPMGSKPRDYLLKRLKHYGMDISHFVEEPLPTRERRSYSKELLQEAAAHSFSIREVLEHLGFDPRDSPYGHIRKKLDQFGIDTSHFISGRRYGPGIVPRDRLVAAIASSRSIAGVLKVLGLVDNGAARERIKRSMSAHGLSIDHFVGQRHRLGVPSKNRQSARKSSCGWSPAPPAPRPRFSDVRSMTSVSRMPVRSAGWGMSGKEDDSSWRSTTSTETGWTTAAQTCGTCVRPAIARRRPSRIDLGAWRRRGAQ